MGALLIHDVCNTGSKAYPTTNLGNQVNLFKPGAFHGGVWRCGYKVRLLSSDRATKGGRIEHPFTPSLLHSFTPSLLCSKGDGVPKDLEEAKKYRAMAQELVEGGEGGL